MTHFFEEYLHILSDPAHLAAEVTFMIVIDLIGFGLVIPLLKRSITRSLRREHARIDREHGIEHHDDHVHRVPENLSSPCAEEKQAHGY